MRLASINKQCQALNWILACCCQNEQNYYFSIIIAVLRLVVVAMIIPVGFSFDSVFEQVFQSCYLTGLDENAKPHLCALSNEIARDVFGLACHKGCTVGKSGLIPRPMLS